MRKLAPNPPHFEANFFKVFRFVVERDGARKTGYDIGCKHSRSRNVINVWKWNAPKDVQVNERPRLGKCHADDCDAADRWHDHDQNDWKFDELKFRRSDPWSVAREGKASDLEPILLRIFREQNDAKPGRPPLLRPAYHLCFFQFV